MKLGFYPGCSMHGTAREYRESLEAIAGPLGIELEEVRDWSCCGASSGHQTSHLLGVALAARNLSLAEEQGHERLLAPCAACYGRLAGARHELQQDAALTAQVGKLLTRPFANAVGVINAIELLRDIAPAIKEKVSRPLQGLKVACYYGCLLVRPPEVAAYDDAEDPSSLETIVKATGAEPVRWHKRTECCGAGLSISRRPSVIRLGREILGDARQAGAQAVVVACPMCHSNLDFRQQAMARGGEPFAMPILYVTQLVGLALGVSAQELGIQRHFVDADPVLAQLAAPRSLPAPAQP